jgi:sterol 24-C-methyltransferase
MPVAAIKPKLQFLKYRVSTVLKSLKTLYSLPQEKVDAFLGSYNIYDHDWANEAHLIEKMGTGYYKEVKKKLIDYYSVLNHLCAIGQVEKMYIPPAIDLSKSIIANQVLYEEKMCRDLEIKKGNLVLDIGCGRGKVAQHVASLTGAHVLGINIDPDQLEAAKIHAKGRGLSDQCEFKMGDINEFPFPFPENSFDAVYQIQVFSLSKNLEKLFQEIHRVLKPGAKLSCLDWVRLPKYDPKNPEHAALMKRIKPLIGAIGTPSAEEYVSSLKKAGFDIIVNTNASIDGLQAPLIATADKFFTRVNRLIQFLVSLKILPKHFKALFDRLTKDGEAFIEADRMRLVTTSHYIVAQKRKG